MEKGNFIFLKEDYKEFKQYEIGIINSKHNDMLNVSFVNSDKTIEINESQVNYFNPEKTGDNFDKKICNRCNRLLDVNFFDKNQNGKNNRSVRRPSCIMCRKIIDGKNVSLEDKREWEKIKPNMIIWECPVCKKRTIPGVTSKVVLDHNHITGKPRAWICDSCNTGLGRFKDDIKTMEDAIDYLKKYK